mmetsp:Transcript_9489/g.25274  ORF Transcript_9489/g.25274 Transcript_9489/m.25274 type:complete len:220 (-) Transcript_9489:565-1224(-)
MYAPFSNPQPCFFFFFLQLHSWMRRKLFIDESGTPVDPIQQVHFHSTLLCAPRQERRADRKCSRETLVAHKRRTRHAPTAAAARSADGNEVGGISVAACAAACAAASAAFSAASARSCALDLGGGLGWRYLGIFMREKRALRDLMSLWRSCFSRSSSSVGGGRGFSGSYLPSANVPLAISASTALCKEGSTDVVGSTTNAYFASPSSRRYSPNSGGLRR